jgi:site-specific DNA-adenine methylase
VIKNGKFDKFIKYFNDNRSIYYKNGSASKEWNKLRTKKIKTLDEMAFMKMAGGKCEMLSYRLIKKDIDKTDYKEDLFKFFMNKELNLTCEDYMKTLEEVKNNKHAFVFLDPPYLSSYNALYKSYSTGESDDDHNIIDMTKIYIDILDFLKTAKCKILLVINKNSINDYLYGKYIKGEYDKRYDMSGNCTKHLIITNY